jgi:hypothetical protein
MCHIRPCLKVSEAQTSQFYFWAPLIETGIGGPTCPTFISKKLRGLSCEEGKCIVLMTKIVVTWI